LEKRDSRRQRTTVAKIPLVGKLNDLACEMSKWLDSRMAFRLPIVIAGALLAVGRRTASRWFAAAGVKDDWDRFYDLLASVGKKASPLTFPLLAFILRIVPRRSDGFMHAAIDDSPTQRYGRHVEGANIHHNPTPGPAKQNWLFGHNWVCLAILSKHPLWNVIALPVLSLMYVRQADVAKLREKYGEWKFQTKHQLALTLVREVMRLMQALGSRSGWLFIVDGAYAAGPFLRALLKEGAHVISRLRRDAELYDLPSANPGRRGRPRLYGTQRISLAKRAGHSAGWQTVTFHCRGADITRRCKTFLATTRLTGGVIRVVLLELEVGQWTPYFSTKIDWDAKTILENGAERWAIEETFHDVKEVCGAGQQQVRNVWSSIGCWNLNTWLYSLVELACWDRPLEQLVDRRDRSWDNPERRPSHADRRRAIRREMLEKQFLHDLLPDPTNQKIIARIQQLLSLAI